MRRNQWILISVLLIVVQILFDGLVNIGVYWCLFPAMFIILNLPYTCKTLATMIIAFVLGFFIDMTGNGITGLNAAAATAVAFARQGLLQMIAGKFIIDKSERPDLFSLGYIKIVGYSAICSFIYLTVFVIAEAGGFSNFLTSLGKISLSTLLNTALMTLMFTLCGKRRRL